MLYVDIFFKKLNYSTEIDIENNRTWDILYLLY